MIEGLGLFFGAAGRFGSARIFNQQTWDQACRQSADWGITWVHPKVADDRYWWYHGGDATQPDPSQLSMLRDVAHHYGLRIAPYHYCWGSAHGHPDQEAQIAGTIANFFDGVCPDMETEWNNQGPLAVRFGQILRQVSPHGQVYPTLYANPNQHPTPYVEINHWCDGWMPMVYFAEWTTAGHQDTAQNAIDFLYEPQWLPLAQHIIHLGGVPKPILPLVELGSGLPPQEIANWLRLMGHYGYCGFWYDGTYGPYASTIKSAPRPAFPQKLSPAPVEPAQSQPYEPVTLSGPGITPTKGESTVKQNLTVDQLHAIWDMSGTNVPFKLDHGIPATWAAMMQQYPDSLGARLGPPLHDEIGITLDGQECTFIDFSGGGRLVYFKSTNSVAFSPSPRMTTQTVVTPAVQAPQTPVPAVNGVAQ